MSLILVLLGLVLTGIGVFLCVMSNITTGIILTLVLGVVLLVYGVKFRVINKAAEKGIPRIIKYVIITGMVIELILVSYIAFFGCFDNADYTEDAVVVLGAGIHGDKVSLPLKFRLDKAVEYHRKNPNAVICVTGGKGFQESVTEAYAMEKYLVSCGVDKNIIVKEEKATSTAENMRYSKEILDKYFENDYKVVVITNGFHVYRSVSAAESEGFENISHISAKIQWYNVVPCYLRESLAVVKMWIFGF